MDDHPLWRRLVAELLGSAFLAAVVIGSGIAAQQLSPADVGLQLFENAAATAAGLFAIILMFGSVSRAHFNPVVSFVDAAFGGLRWRRRRRLPARPGGGLHRRGGGGEPHVQPGRGQHLDQASGLGRPLPLRDRRHPRAAPGDLRPRTDRPEPVGPCRGGAYIGAAYFFTSSTSFANPAITVGRMFSNTFAGIAPILRAHLHRRPGGRGNPRHCRIKAAVSMIDAHRGGRGDRLPPFNVF